MQRVELYNLLKAQGKLPGLVKEVLDFSKIASPLPEMQRVELYNLLKAQDKLARLVDSPWFDFYIIAWSLPEAQRADLFEKVKAKLPVPIKVAEYARSWILPPLRSVVSSMRGAVSSVAQFIYRPPQQLNESSQPPRETEPQQPLTAAAPLLFQGQQQANGLQAQDTNPLEDSIAARVRRRRR